MAVRRTSKPSKDNKKRRKRLGSDVRAKAGKSAGRGASSAKKAARQKAKKAKGSPKPSGARGKKAKGAKPKRAAPVSRKAKRGTKSPNKRGAAAPNKAKAAKGREREKAQREKERLRLTREKEKERAAKEKEKQRLLKERAKEQERAAKEKERLQKEREKEKERAAKEKEKQRLLKEHAKGQERAAKEKEKQRLLKEKELLEKEKARAAAKVAALKAKEESRVRQKAEREAEKARQKTEREAARAREKAEREAERDRLREETRRKKEEERARREAEREAYRKAKEAEQARIRAEREAARRALEGRIARAVGRANRGGQGRSSTTRVYSPASIPDQSGTRRGLESSDPNASRLAALAGEGREEEPRGPVRRTLPPPPPVPPPATIEERYAHIREALQAAGEGFRKAYEESLLMSWIYHDSALEGGVYTYEELKTAIDPSMTVVPDSSLQSVCDEIRRHKAAIELVLDLADKKRTPFTIDTIKRIYLTLHPEEGDLKTVKYRKDIPQHRLYFHEYAAPDKIAYKVRQVLDWLNGPEAKKLKSPVRIAARVHYDLLRVFPFATDSGKVARLVMNLLLLRADCPPALIHSTERQRYYEALRSSLPTLVTMINEAINNGLASIEKRLEEHASHKHALIS